MLAVIMAISDIDLTDLKSSDFEQLYQLFKLSIQDLVFIIGKHGLYFGYTVKIKWTVKLFPFHLKYMEISFRLLRLESDRVDGDVSIPISFKRCPSLNRLFDFIELFTEFTNFPRIQRDTFRSNCLGVSFSWTG